jgi:hypothetical protein
LILVGRGDRGAGSDVGAIANYAPDTDLTEAVAQAQALQATVTTQDTQRTNTFPVTGRKRQIPEIPTSHGRRP